VLGFFLYLALAIMNVVLINSILFPPVSAGGFLL